MIDWGGLVKLIFSLFILWGDKRNYTKDEPTHNQNDDGCFCNSIASKPCAFIGSQKGDQKETEQAANDGQQTYCSLQPTIGYFV